MNLSREKAYYRLDELRTKPAEDARLKHRI